MKSSFMRLGCLGWQARLLLGTSSPKYTRSPFSILRPREASFTVSAESCNKGRSSVGDLFGDWLKDGQNVLGLGNCDMFSSFWVVTVQFLQVPKFDQWGDVQKLKVLGRNMGDHQSAIKKPSSTIWMVAEIGHPHNPSYLYLGLF